MPEDNQLDKRMQEVLQPANIVTDEDPLTKAPPERVRNEKKTKSQIVEEAGEVLKALGVDMSNPDPEKMFQVLQGMLAKSDAQEQTKTEWLANMNNKLNIIENNLAHLYVINSMLCFAFLGIDPYERTVQKKELPLLEMRAAAQQTRAILLGKTMDRRIKPTKGIYKE